MAGKTRTINGKTCVSTAFLAEIFGVTNKTLSEWEKKGCPKIQRGYWCPADVLKWRDSTAHETKENPDTLPPAQRKLYWDADCKKEQFFLSPAGLLFFVPSISGVNTRGS